MKKACIAALVAVCLATIALVVPGIAKSNASESGKTFADVIGKDFFAGVNGDKASMDRAIGICEDALAKDPKHPEAMVWQGACWVYLSGDLFKSGKIADGYAQWTKGLNRLDEAVALAPKDPAVLIPRGITLLVSAEYERQPAKAKSMAEKGVLDLETSLNTPGIGFNTWPDGARGRILLALADGYNRSCRPAEARACYQRIVDELDGTEYAATAQACLDK